MMATESLERFFQERLAGILGIPPKEVSDDLLRRELKAHIAKKGRLRRPNSLGVGGNISAKYLGHLDDTDFEALKKRGDRIMAEIKSGKTHEKASVWGRVMAIFRS